MKYTATCHTCHVSDVEESVYAALAALHINLYNNTTTDSGPGEQSRSTDEKGVNILFLMVIIALSLNILHVIVNGRIQDEHNYALFQRTSIYFFNLFHAVNGELSLIKWQPFYGLTDKNLREINHRRKIS